MFDLLKPDAISTDKQDKEKRPGSIVIRGEFRLGKSNWRMAGGCSA